MSQPYRKKTQTSYWCLQGSDWPGWFCVCHFVLLFYILLCFLSNSLKFTGSFQPQNLQTSSYPPWDYPLSPSSRHLLLSLQVPLRLHLLGKSILWDSEKHPFPCCMLSWHSGLLLNMYACMLSRVWLFHGVMDCSSPGSSVHGILQARILEWVAVSSSRGSSRPRDQTHISYISFIGRQILYHSATWEAPS